MQAPSTTPIWIAPVLSGVLSAAVVAPLTARLAWLNERKKRRLDLTSKFIDEFYSDAFLHHRVAFARLRRKVADGEATMAEVAAGFWYPGGSNAYEGENHGGSLNEHQHLEAVLGYVKRLANALRQKEAIDVAMISAALGSSYLWMDDFLTGLASEIDGQIVRHGGPGPYSSSYTACAIRTVTDCMRLQRDVNEPIAPNPQLQGPPRPVAESSSGISISRLYQAAWFIVSVYFSVLIIDVTKDGLVQMAFGTGLSTGRMWIIIPTLFLYLLSAIEANLWLKPEKDTSIPRPIALLRLLQLVGYFVAVILQAFLSRACTDRGLDDAHAFSLWARYMGFVLVLYSVYSLLPLLFRALPAHGFDAFTPPIRMLVVWVLFYLLCASSFLGLSASVGHMSISMYGPAIAALFAIYQLAYLYIWRDWYTGALQSDYHVGISSH